ncbi:hypothetical protein ABT282_08830 [Streptomyces sp. NPDC000927]|uniref:hypothetical protein n=1 Tax=Streptomyces sp. NPDC000927 TaxID=3154371 RepID=UPI003324BD98
MVNFSAPKGRATSEQAVLGELLDRDGHVHRDLLASAGEESTSAREGIDILRAQETVPNKFALTDRTLIQVEIRDSASRLRRNLISPAVISG